EAAVRPGTRIDLDVRGGSGRTRCELLVDVSGAALTDDCTYTAGTGTGQDTIRVVDLETREAVDAWVEVGVGHALRVVGADGLFVPRGARLRVEAVHGSGHLALEAVAGGLTVDGDTIVGDAPAKGRVRVTDRFTGEAVE